MFFCRSHFLDVLAGLIVGQLGFQCIKHVLWAHIVDNHGGAGNIELAGKGFGDIAGAGVVGRDRAVFPAQRVLDLAQLALVENVQVADANLDILVGGKQVLR